ncbi:MAG: TIGR03986 family CRISPR-associated RAMP protein [Hungatella sp.]|nr:TIGR03986 family CRISPR-associated RAMP protein [Hungatella sp.]
MGAQYKRSKNLKFINPYTFVPTPRNKKVNRSGLDERGSGNLHTGVLTCRLYVRTPLGIPDAELAGKDRNEHTEYPFFSYKDGEKSVYAIPGSSLRGPLRSVFETATDSCFSTLRKDTGLSRRVSNREAYSPGILRWEKGEWHLYKADRYLLAVDPKGGKSYTKYGNWPSNTYVTISGKGKDKPRIARTAEGEELRYGDRVDFRAYREGEGAYKKGGVPIWAGVAKDVRLKRGGTDGAGGRLTGFVYIGETFGRKKHGESIFVPVSEVKDLTGEQLQKAYEGLLEALDIYRDSAVNRSKDHSGYKDFDHAQREQGIPVWYDIGDQKLSPASIGRTFYRTTLNELAGDRQPCTDRKQLCEACALFGMAGVESLGSRIRISDAAAVGEPVSQKAALMILGQPRYSYMPFYAKAAAGVPRSYDEKHVEIAGRKFYWHNKKAAEDKSIYAAKDGDNMKNQMNSTMELVMPGAEFCFRIYYDGITEEQLEKLMWCVNFGENIKEGDLCHKLGHGKPLGLGSVKIVIEENEERIFRDGMYEWKRKTPCKEGGTPELKNMNALKRVMNFKGPGQDIPIMYPDVADVDGRPFKEPRSNDSARHVWYAKNKESKRERDDPTEMLPNINKGDQALHGYVKTADEGFQRGARNNSRFQNGNYKNGGRK